MREKSCFSLINKKASGFIFLPEFINIKLILLRSYYYGIFKISNCIN